MKTKKNHENSQRFAEYYKKNNPELTNEQCEEKAKWFKRSCNYQCIEYYEKNYLNLSNDEHLKKNVQNIMDMIYYIFGNMITIKIEKK